MSLGGILGAGLAGGAKAVGDQLTTDIKNQEDQRIWSERQAILEQANLRALDYQDKIAKNRLLFENDPTQAGGAARLGFAKATAQQQTDEDVRKAAALAVESRKQDIAAANDPDWMKAFKARLMADPRVSAEVAAHLAAAGASNMHTKLALEQLNETKAAFAVATDVRNLQASLAKETDPVKRAAIEQQITDRGFSGKDTTKYLALVDKARDNATNALKLAMDPSTPDDVKTKALLQWQKANNEADQYSQMAGVKPQDVTDKPKTEAEAQATASAALRAGKDPAAVKALMDRWGYAMPVGAAPTKPSTGGGGMLGPTNWKNPGEQGSDEIKTIPAGFGTATYRYRGTTYYSLDEAQKAKQQWNE